MSSFKKVTVDEVSVLCFTWNVGNAKPNPSEHTAWLPYRGKGLDLIVVGTQENSGWDRDKQQQASQRQARNSLQSSTRLSFVSTPAQAKATSGITLVGVDGQPAAEVTESVTLGKWEQIALDRLGNEWAVCHHIELMSMRLTLYARKAAIETMITDVVSARSATGIGGQLGNKGGLVIGLKYGRTSLGFVSCHLAAHMHKVADRNEDFWEVLRETRVKAGASPLLDATFSFEHVVFMGDLNYRVQFPDDGNDLESDSDDEAKDTPEGTEKAIALVNKKAYAELVEHDQLRLSQAEGTAFIGFQEGPLAYPPTFKVERRAGTRYKLKRVPSYCDRILWKSMPGYEDGILQRQVHSLPSVTTSDHKPVLAHFAVTQPSPVPRALEADRAHFPVVRLSNVHVYLKGAPVDFLTDTCDPYAAFFTHPPGLLGDDAPVSAVTKSSKHMPVKQFAARVHDERAKAHLQREVTTVKLPDEDMRGYTVSWSTKQLPLLRPQVLGGEDELRKIAIVIAMFDLDYASDDDSLGTIAIGLGRPQGARGTDEEYSFDVRSELPWEQGVGFFTATVTVSFGGAVPAALAKAHKEKAGMHASHLSHLGVGVGCGGFGRACVVQ